MAPFLLNLRIKSIFLRFNILKNHLGFHSYNLKLIGIAFSRSNPLQVLLAQYKVKHRDKFYKYMDKSYSQMFQDLIVMDNLNWLENGIYIEIGALDGITHSNTILLEQYFNWNGILVEPNPQFSCHLKKYRGNNHLDFSVVSSRSDEKLQLLIAKDKGHSTLTEFKNQASIYTDQFEVYSISLNSLIRKYHLPVKINYLSIDTEGGELKILESFNFKDYDIDFISIEHNYSPERSTIFELLTRHGFTRVFENISSVDDWYISTSTTFSQSTIISKP